MLRYRARISGPLLDRIDLHVPVSRVPFQDLGAEGEGRESPAIRERVREARKIQRARFGVGKGIYANGQMGPGEIRRFCRPSRDVARLLQRALDGLNLSARAYHRILKVARTIADLEGATDIGTPHVGEAIQYRSLDRKVPV